MGPFLDIKHAELIYICGADIYVEMVKVRIPAVRPCGLIVTVFPAVILI
jgi:hypothetical protein